MREVGADRIMFGTDAPYHPAAVEAMKVMTSGLTEKQIKDVFYNKKLMGFDKNNFPRTREKGGKAEVSSVSRFR